MDSEYQRRYDADVIHFGATTSADKRAISRMIVEVMRDEMKLHRTQQLSSLDLCSEKDII